MKLFHDLLAQVSETGIELTVIAFRSRPGKRPSPETVAVVGALSAVEMEAAACALSSVRRIPLSTPGCG